MQSKSKHIRVHMPNDSFFEVSYYCNDKKLTATQKKTSTQLYIQHHDCLCVINIAKSVCDNDAELENVVHNKVINTKGHLC